MDEWAFTELLQLDEVIEDRNRMLMTRNQDTGQDGMGFCSRLVAIAAIGFPSDHCRSDHPFGLIVGGVQTVHIQETQQMRTVLPQALGKAGIVSVSQPALRRNQLIQSSFQGSSPLSKGEGIQTRLLRLQLYRLLQQDGHLSGKVQSSTGLPLPHLLQIREQMRQAFLFEPSAQSLFVIRQESIGGQDPFELPAENIDDHVTRAVGADGGSTQSSLVSQG